MTVGERIQAYRKQLGLSQDELGQKLLVSRQTISLWEKNQTVPTLDNLKRLRSIFNVSVDEILGFNNNEQVPENTPNETYQFNYSKSELNNIHKAQKTTIYKKAIPFTLISIFLIVYFIISDTSNIMTGFALGAFIIWLTINIKSNNAYNQSFIKNIDHISESTYEYLLFDEYLNINIYRNKELVRKSKFFYNDIEKATLIDKWLILIISGQSFILRKDALTEDSVFYSFLYKKQSNNIKKLPQDKNRMISIILFIASFLSLFAALFSVGITSNFNKMFVENMWLFFLWTPIPIASVVFGYKLKARGYKYQKNVITGFIMAALLCIYGSFSFIFADTFDHSDIYITKAEQMLKIDIPEHTRINTQDYTKTTQVFPRGYIYTVSDIYFSESAVEDFENEIKHDNRWLTSVPNNLFGITSPLCDYSKYDYVLIYNIDTEEFNVLPSDNGTYRFINIIYKSNANEMKIIDHSIDYIK